VKSPIRIGGGMEIQPIDITQIIVTIITSTSAIIIAWLRRKEKIERKQITPQEKIALKITKLDIMIYICIILLVANLGVFGWRYWWGPTTEVKITYPYDDASVEIREMIRGTSQSIPEGQVVWIIVYPQITGRYYPQNALTDIQANGDWSSPALIGIEEDVGKKFDIIVVLANKEAQESLNAYLAQFEDKKTWPGLEKLPNGAVIYDRITITRE